MASSPLAERFLKETALAVRLMGADLQQELPKTAIHQLLALGATELIGVPIRKDVDHVTGL